MSNGDSIRNYCDVLLTNRENRFQPSDDEAVVLGIVASSQDDASQNEKTVEEDGVVSQAAGNQGKWGNPEQWTGEGQWKKFHCKKSRKC